ncbi:MAG: ABC transporter, NBP/MSD fusion protein, partial [Streptococcus sp. DORA_10]
ISVAHRLSTVIEADRIMVLEHGRVVGEGTHSQLLESVPLYKELAKEQLLV